MEDPLAEHYWAHRQHINVCWGYDLYDFLSTKIEKDNCKYKYPVHRHHHDGVGIYIL